MVLENSSNETIDQLFTDEPISDKPPDEGPRSGYPVLQYHIDTVGLPKPFPIIGTLFGYDKKFQLEAQFKLMFTTKELGRPLTQDEVDAFAYWLAKRQAVASWGHPIGLAGGLWRAYKTHEVFQFPFWKTNKNALNINIFGPLKGPPAVFIWHSLRVLAYSMTGNLVGRILFNSYAMSIAAVGATSDPRLKECMNTIRDKIHNISQKGGNPQESITKSGQKVPKPILSTNDDASPLNMSEFFNNKLENEPVNTSTNSINQEGALRAPPISNSKLFQPRGTDNDPFGDYCSPSLSDQQGVTGDTNSEILQLSAWEKIRNGQHVPPLNPSKNLRSTRKYKIDESNPESFSYSKSEEERSYAKDETQRKFEEQIERERNGPYSN